MLVGSHYANHVNLQDILDQLIVSNLFCYLYLGPSRTRGQNCLLMSKICHHNEKRSATGLSTEGQNLVADGQTSKMPSTTSGAGKLVRWKTRSAGCGVRSVENEECGKWQVWKMRGVENVECGNMKLTNNLIPLYSY